MATSAPPSMAMQRLRDRIAERIDAPVDPAVVRFARSLAWQSSPDQSSQQQPSTRGILFYGSNLRTGSLDGVLDFYRLQSGNRTDRIWPRISYHEECHDGAMLRAKTATMDNATFDSAARGDLIDTTIWARFVQPCALVWHADDAARSDVIAALAQAAVTAARLAAALGPQSGTPDDFWRALFKATYKAEFRVESEGREHDILGKHRGHFDGLLPLALEAGGIGSARARTAGDGATTRLKPHLTPKERARILAWWRRRRRLGKPLNLARLVKASATFEGAARYGAWKIERHTGMPVEVTPFRERHPILAAPGVFLALRKHRRKNG